jgi:hypothetical protein
MASASERTAEDQMTIVTKDGEIITWTIRGPEDYQKLLKADALWRAKQAQRAMSLVAVSPRAPIARSAAGARIVALSALGIKSVIG